MVTVPALTPVTLPAASTEAVVLSEEDQVPPAVASVRVMVDPAQMVDKPPMADTVGSALTVIDLVALLEQVPLE